jgi:hypothetical protein
MNTTIFDQISTREMFGEEADLHLAKNIRDAAGEAHEIVECGEFIRDRHKEGNVNSSLESTYEGVQKVADVVASNITLEERPEPLFGQHFNELIAAFRPLWRKK